MKIKKITLFDLDIFNKYIGHQRCFKLTSEVNFTNIYIWSDIYNYHYTIFNNIIWVFSIDKDNNIEVLPPIGNINKHLSIIAIESFVENIISATDCYNICFTRLSNLYLGNLSSISSEIQPLPMHDDYVYSAEDMSVLPKKAYRKKIQLINKIKARHECETIEIKKSNIHLCANILTKCNGGIVTDGISNETIAAHNILNNFFELGCDGVITYVDGVASGFSIGEKLDADTYVIHLEKGLKQFEGIYQLMFQDFSKKILSKYTYINKEQDLGLKGLRQAKKSYRPCYMINKYKVQIHNNMKTREA